MNRKNPNEPFILGSHLETIKVAFVIPDQYWSGSISLLVDVLSGINMLIQQEGIYSASHYEMHFLHDPAVIPKGMSECHVKMRELDNVQYDIVIIPAIWSITPKELKN